MTASILILLLTGASPVSEYIQAVTPKLSAKEALRLGTLVEAVATKQSLDPFLLAAIIRRESSFRSGLKSCWLVKRHGGQQVTCDHGLAQINETWIGTWGLDPEKLQNDDLYNLNIASRILARLYRQYGELEPQTWWSRYNSGTPSKRAAYQQAVEPFLLVLPQQSSPIGEPQNAPDLPVFDQLRERQLV